MRARVREDLTIELPPEIRSTLRAGEELEVFAEEGEIRLRRISKQPDAIWKIVGIASTDERNIAEDHDAYLYADRR